MRRNGGRKPISSVIANTGKIVLYALIIWPMFGVFFGCIAAILLIEPYRNEYTYGFAIDFGIPIGWLFGTVLGVCTSWICLIKSLPVCLGWLSAGSLAGIVIAWGAQLGPLGFYSLSVLGYSLGFLLILTKSARGA
jgi:hypothetical protein